MPLPAVPDYKGSYSARDWSGDGNKLLLLFYDADSESSETGIRVFDFKTSTYQKMTDSGSYPIWLKDNRHFIFDDRNTLFVFDTLTKKATGICKPASYAIQHANVSPDNRLIYFRYLQVDANVWLLDASR